MGRGPLRNATPARVWDAFFEVYHIATIVYQTPGDYTRFFSFTIHIVRDPYKTLAAQCPLGLL